jgi:hypothetical protein
MNKLLCKLGFHDWFIEDSRRQQDIEQKILLYAISPRYYRVFFKVCLRCKRTIDQISQYEDFCKEEKSKQDLRLTKANDIISRRKK